MLKLDVLEDPLVVVRLEADEPMPTWADGTGQFLAVVRTPSELSIVASQTVVPDDVRVVGPWRALRVQGTLSFELTGILAALATPLAQAKISIFAISTFDTDYVLVRTDQLTKAISTLRDAGHQLDEP